MEYVEGSRVTLFGKTSRKELFMKMKLFIKT